MGPFIGTIVPSASHIQRGYFDVGAGLSALLLIVFVPSRSVLVWGLGGIQRGGVVGRHVVSSSFLSLGVIVDARLWAWSW